MKDGEEEKRCVLFEGAEIVYLGWIMAGLVKGYAAAAKHSHS